MKKLNEITLEELAIVEHAHVIEGMRELVLDDEEFWAWTKEVCDISDKFDYELLEDGLINVQAIEDYIARG